MLLQSGLIYWALPSVIVWTAELQTSARATPPPQSLAEASKCRCLLSLSNTRPEIPALQIRSFLSSMRSRLSRKNKQSADPYVDPEANQLSAYRIADGRLDIVAPISDDGTLPSTPISADVLQPAGYAKIEGLVFDMRKPGLYRFWRLPSISQQRLVLPGSLDDLLSHMGFMWVYGDRDNDKSIKELIATARHRRISAGCGTIARLAKALLELSGYRARLVALMTSEQWGGQDDGHTLLEVEGEDKSWFAYDPSFNRRFRLNGRLLSAAELPGSQENAFELESLPGNSGHEEYTAQGYDYGFWLEERFLSNECLLTWYKRLSEVPMIEEDGVFTVSALHLKESDISRFAARYRVIPDNLFRDKFYN